MAGILKREKGSDGKIHLPKVLYDAFGEDGPDLGYPSGADLPEIITLPESILNYKYFRAGVYLNLNDGITAGPGVIMSNWTRMIGNSASLNLIVPDPITDPESLGLVTAVFQVVVRAYNNSFQLTQRYCDSRLRKSNSVIDAQSKISNSRLYRLEASNII